ncbi:peptide chain release factor H [Taibaiella koreensis]|uniref:peptide chain release factor H n=1 Tax=Taibaiella koreensis TaxID=1268548 RepID=UPI000E59FE13|nr:peptide chain release factor H [Taibaiella koreensis]
MEKIIIQISSGRGPAECCRVVARVQELMLQHARTTGIRIEVLDNKKAGLRGTLLSATLMAEGPSLRDFVAEWEGTLQWIAQSPYRKMYKRRNWFVGIAIFPIQTPQTWQDKDVYFETMRASGPGGQHVNKVETAVRGVHKPSGLQATASDHRSQLQNRKLCQERLKQKVIAWQTEQLMKQQTEQWQEHNQLERGNATRTIVASLN